MERELQKLVFPQTKSPGSEQYMPEATFFGDLVFIQCTNTVSFLELHLAGASVTLAVRCSVATHVLLPLFFFFFKNQY